MARPRPRWPSRLIRLSATKAKITLRRIAPTRLRMNAAIAQALNLPVPG